MDARPFRTSLLPLLAALVAAAGCSRRASAPDLESPAEAPGEAATVVAPPEPPGFPSVPDAALGVPRTIEPPAPLPGAEANVPDAVDFESSDGVLLHADLWRTGDPEAPAVVLVHQARSDRSEWASFVSELRARAPGLTVLALDLRGHGASTRAGDATVR
jgi:hypothetical protein